MTSSTIYPDRRAGHNTNVDLRIFHEGDELVFLAAAPGGDAEAVVDEDEVRDIYCVLRDWLAMRKRGKA